MDWLELFRLFMAFLVSNILGYGGGPASIPLTYAEVVDRYAFVTPTDFSNIIALGNALPGPIATKIAAYVGYNAGGVFGSFVAQAATVVPSIIALIMMLKLLQKHRESKIVKGIGLLVQPVIAVLMAVLTWDMVHDSLIDIGWLQTILLAAIAWWAMAVKKIHPAFVVVAAFLYGGIVIPLLA
ncbi:putative transporter YwrA [Paenibacillus montaniterrae]|uniref:Transporter YwrA n=1 Tax=Paenibacillus montaniterrae TaxID=429341 RepID=A0A919YRG4_9BACL|nr:chromate transporter [Paenibacillus montaniterrae]GIP18733.1 putative transporter YwrA [Paenibacillus montaniterrae]